MYYQDLLLNVLNCDVTHDHVSVRVEKVVVGRVGDLVNVHVHTSVVAPVVRATAVFSTRIPASEANNSQSDNEADTVSLGSGDDVV